MKEQSFDEAVTSFNNERSNNSFNSNKHGNLKRQSHTNFNQGNDSGSNVTDIIKLKRNQI